MSTHTIAPRTAKRSRPQTPPAAPGGRRWKTTLTFLASFALLVTVWWLITAYGGVQDYLLPAPDAVARSLVAGLTEPLTSEASILYQFGETFRAAFIGLLSGGLLGILIGTIAAQSALLERLLMPYVFALQSMPKVAIAPLLMIWFGFDLTSKTILAAILVFFPMVVNTFTGMNLASREHVRLFASLRASRLDVIFRLRLPTALPLILAGVEIAVVQSLLGAVVAEFIAGQAGIGTLIIRYQSVNDTASVFAALVVLAVAGVLMHTIVRFCRLRLVFWNRADTAH